MKTLDNFCFSFKKFKSPVSIFSVLCSLAERAERAVGRQGQVTAAEDLSAPLSQNFPLICERVTLFRCWRIWDTAVRVRVGLI